MPLLDLQKLTAGLSTTWAGFLRDWDRTLRAGNYPETTRYNYLLAAGQLGRYLAEHSPDPDADAAADDPIGGRARGWRRPARCATGPRVRSGWRAGMGTLLRISGNDVPA